MRHPSYCEAIHWIIANDDCDWLDDEYGSISVTAALVADLFGVDDERVKRNLRKTRDRLARQAPVAR